MVKRKKQKVETCWDRDRCKCKVHDRKCVIPVSFPDGDDRNRFLSEMKRIGVHHVHTKDKEHRCDLCELERQEGRRSGWYQVDPKDGKIKTKIVIEKLMRQRKEKQDRIKANLNKAYKKS